MNAINKAAGQTAANMRVLFQLLDSSGTPSISKVSPVSAASDISVADTATGIATITIKNFKGPQGAANIQLTSRTLSLIVSAVSVSYSGDDLSFVIHIDADGGTDTDASVDVLVEAY